MQRALVVGAGLAGLAAAHELAGEMDVTVIDRLPAAGGTAGWSHPLVRSLQRSCRQADVQFLLGTTALSWQSGRLLVAAPGNIRWLSGDQLVCAAGSRPATMAELRLVGARLAGVVSATVAKHLLEASVHLGRRPVIIGVGDWSATIAGLLHDQGALVSVVSQSVATRRPAYADEWWPGWRAASVLGTSRVDQLTVTRDGNQFRLLCDAVILADDIRPLRNIEGAVFGGERVTFIQEVAPQITAEAVVAGAVHAARRLRTGVGRTVE
jgi:NADPH-dependent 2,4-dienoyl-CoA reductase/sulfur reductase-like enzyme